MEYMRIGRTNFNVEHCKSMTQKEFVERHQRIKRFLPAGMTLEEVYKKLGGKAYKGDASKKNDE